MRGKTKIGISALMLSVILSSMFMVVAPVSATPTASLTLTSVMNPLLEPGDTFTVDLLVRDVTRLWSVQFGIAYDTSVLTCIDYAPVRANPIALVRMLPSGIDDPNGIMWMGASRVLGDTVGITTGSYPLLIALVTFRIDARGESELALFDIALTNVYGNPIDAIGYNGYFNNKLQGYIMAPKITDTGMVPDSFFDVFISVREVVKLWGVQFYLYFDPKVLTGIEYEGLAPLTETETGLNEIGPNYFRIAFHSYFGDPDGLTTYDPYPVVRLRFQVKAAGATLLDLRDTVMADADGNKLVHGVEDGSFGNTYAIAVAIDTGFVEDHNYQLSKDPDKMITLTGQVKSVDAGITTVRVRFTVLDAEGFPVANVYSEEYWGITPGGNVRLSVDIDATKLRMPALYDVVFRVEYLDATGAWVTGQKGSASGNRSTMVKALTVEA